VKQITGEYMFLQDLTVSYVAIVIAALLYFLLGCIWYSPRMCGKYCVKNEAPSSKSRCIPSFAGEFLLNLLMAFVMAIFIQLVQADELLVPLTIWGEIKEAFFVGFWIWLGFVFTTHLSTVLWGGKSFKHFLIHTSFNLIGLILMAMTIIYITQ
jgi:hypothetical protein